LLDTAFLKLRAEADAWHAARDAFMMSRLRAGRHPDTDPSFWRGYTERPASGLPTKSVPEAYRAWNASRQRMAVAVVIGVPGTAVGLVAGWVAIRSAKARRRKARPAAPVS